MRDSFGFKEYAIRRSLSRPSEDIVDCHVRNKMEARSVSRVFDVDLCTVWGSN